MKKLIFIFAITGFFFSCPPVEDEVEESEWATSGEHIISYVITESTAASWDVVTNDPNGEVNHPTSSTVTWVHQSTFTIDSETTVEFTIGSAGGGDFTVQIGQGSNDLLAETNFTLLPGEEESFTRKLRNF